MRRLFLAFFTLFLPLSAQIEAVIFDWGNVMSIIDFDIVFDTLDSELNISRDMLRERFPYFKEMQRGALPEEEFWLGFRDDLPSNWKEIYQGSFSSALIPIEGMEDLVRSLHEKGYQTPLLSNISPFGAEVISAQGGYGLFDPLVLSHEACLAKPNPAIYLYILGLLELEPHQCIFIDDKLENVEAAQVLGIHAIHFTDFQSLVRDLQVIGIQ